MTESHLKSAIEAVLRAAGRTREELDALERLKPCSLDHYNIMLDDVTGTILIVDPNAWMGWRFDVKGRWDAFFVLDEYVDSFGWVTHADIDDLSKMIRAGWCDQAADERRDS